MTRWENVNVASFPLLIHKIYTCIFQKVMGNKLLKEIPITKYPKPIQKSFQNQSPKPIQKSFRNQNPNPIQKLILIISQGLNSQQKRTLQNRNERNHAKKKQKENHAKKEPHENIKTSTHPAVAEMPVHAPGPALPAPLPQL